MKSVSIKIYKTDLQSILPFRGLFLQENNVQIRYDACHRRGWSDSYVIMIDGVKAGYGSVKGNEHIEHRDTVFEFYLIPAFRDQALTAFELLLKVSGVSFIESQTNEPLLTSFAYLYGTDLSSDTILFRDKIATDLILEEGVFRPKAPNDKVFEHRAEPVGDFVVEWRAEIVATGGFLLHYNMPFADLYMEVREDCRQMGFGSLLVQEVKLQCYLSGRVPAARTGFSNLASRATLLRAGFEIAGHMLLAKLK